MWSNVISIEKGYEKEIDYLLGGVENIKDLSFAVEESRDRIWIYLASICEVAEAVEEKILCLVENVFLTYLKLRFFLEKLDNVTLNHSNCALLCSLVHFDRAYESGLLRKTLCALPDFNIDGVYNFRFSTVKDNWEELAALASKLLSGADSEDVFDIAAFITSTEGANSRLAVSGKRLVNLTTRRVVEIPKLFDEEEYNYLSAIIGERPDEIILEDSGFSPSMNATLKHIAHVIDK